MFHPSHGSDLRKSPELETLEGAGGRGTGSSCLPPVRLDIGYGAHAGRDVQGQVFEIIPRKLRLLQLPLPSPHPLRAELEIRPCFPGGSGIGRILYY